MSVGTVAPISKKPNVGSTGKSGVGAVVSKSGKTGSGFGSGSKSSNVFGSSGKSSKTSSTLSGTMGSGAKSNSTFGSNAKTSSNAFVIGGKSSAPRTPSFVPLGTSGKDSSFRPSDKKPAAPLLVGGKTSSVFGSSPNKSYPSTSFPSQAKPKTALGIIWIPGRKRNKKKDYVYVPHNDAGYKERSPSMYPHENTLFRFYVLVILKLFGATVYVFTVKMQENPQENNNFETIISTWRRLSGELVEAPVFTSMSGDSSNHPSKKKEEDSSLLALERPKGPIATAASAGAAVIATDDKPLLPQDPVFINPDEKQEKPETKEDKEETKEASGDANYDNDKESRSFLDNESEPSKISDSKNPKDRGDKVDSVYLRPPPAHKVRSNVSTNDDEDCGIKCLYYTLQCCDCVLM
ncbi:hypothetical protein NE865_01275 [Phthorimaea operculella]|nr:hypothetical protein NE865_01275 [Phthorimaea operculella]